MISSAGRWMSADTDTTWEAMWPLARRTSVRYRAFLSSYSLFPTSCTLCQVMWPSLYLSPGQTAETVTQSSVLHRAVVSLARSLLGPDMDFDFDMLISKEGGSTVETPWHQDESYWLDLPDKVNRILI